MPSLFAATNYSRVLLSQGTARTQYALFLMLPLVSCGVNSAGR